MSLQLPEIPVFCKGRFSLFSYSILAGFLKYLTPPHCSFMAVNEQNKLEFSAVSRSMSPTGLYRGRWGGVLDNWDRGQALGPGTLLVAKTRRAFLGMESIGIFCFVQHAFSFVFFPLGIVGSPA